MFTMLRYELRGFVKLKKSKNLRKTRKWWVGEAPTRIGMFFLCVFVLFFIVVHVSKTIRIFLGFSNFFIDKTP